MNSLHIVKSEMSAPKEKKNNFNRNNCITTNLQWYQQKYKSSLYFIMVSDFSQQSTTILTYVQLLKNCH
jgi:hypothetical protein